MYAAYFGLKQEPFSIAPDPRLLFMSERHREALAHLLYGVQGTGGFVLLTGEVGTGKTTVCRSFLEQVPAHCNLAYIFNPKLTVPELLDTICHEFGIVLPPAQPGRARTVKDYLDPLNAFLLQAHAQGRNNLLVIDEAQNLSADVLEQLRLLTNLETSERKLLQIILVGQPELRDMLARPELEQLAQRVVARYHLRSLDAGQAADYVQHRMQMCGLKRPLPFDRAALQRIHQRTAGVPRRINLLCDRSLLGAYATGEAVVTRRIVDQAADEVFGAAARRSRPVRPFFLVGLGLAAAGALAVHLLPQQAHVARPRPPATVPVVVASAPALAASQSEPVASAPALPASTPVPPPRLLDDEKQAWRELGEAWKLVLPEGGDPCQLAQREDLQCFSRKLPLALIRQLDRPGIVTLDAAAGRPSYALLVALGESSATLRADGTEQTVTLAALAERWDGDFATLWRSPVGFKARAAKGPAVDWLTTQLAAIKGPDAVAAKAGTTALAAQIHAFQLAQGLPADGKPGAMTYMQLNRAAGIDEPRLRKLP